MAVLIKGQKPPTDCAHCFYYKVCRPLINHVINDEPDFNGWMVPYNYKLDNCPIIEVPEEE